MVARIEALLGLALVLGAASCSEGPVSRPGDVLLITVDTLRADHVGLYGYTRATTPHLDRFFAAGAIFERSYATEANTSPSVVSILSGLLPQDHRVRLLYQLLPDETALLPDLLPDAYQTVAVVSNLVLTDEAIGLASRFDHFDDFVVEREPYRPIFERNAASTTDAALRWLREERDASRPLFLWVHYIDPHGPYHPPPDWDFSFDHDEPVPIDPERVPRHQREPGVADGLTYVDRYDEEIAYTDFHLGRLLEGFSEAVSIDDALVLFTADHGESMMEHERWFTHGYHVYEEILAVPLLVRGPGVVPGRRTSLASGIDLAPTVLGFAGADVPARMAGYDLRRASTPPQRTVYAEATFQSSQWRAAIQSDRKWIVRLHPEEGRVGGSVFDLALDPGESAPRPFRSSGGAVRRLIELYEADPDPAGIPRELREGMRITAPKVDPRASPSVRDKLRELGYVE